MRLLAVTDATLDRLALRFRRSWRPLAANDVKPISRPRPLTLVDC